MAKHTPGPWLLIDGTFVYTLEEFSNRVGRNDVRNRFYTQVWGGPVTPRPELEANARLIQAAPELLEALDQMVEYVNATLHGCPLPSSAAERMADAERVIARATGGGQ